MASNDARKRRGSRCGATAVEAVYVRTSKNKPCLEFLQRSGFRADGDDFYWDTAEAYACPEVIQLSFGAA